MMLLLLLQIRRFVQVRQVDAGLRSAGAKGGGRVCRRVPPVLRGALSAEPAGRGAARCGRADTAADAGGCRGPRVSVGGRAAKPGVVEERESDAPLPQQEAGEDTDADAQDGHGEA